MPDIEGEISSIKTHINQHCDMVNEQKQKNLAYDSEIAGHAEKIKNLEDKLKQQSCIIETLTQQLDTLKKFIYSIPNTGYGGCPGTCKPST